MTRLAAISTFDLGMPKLACHRHGGIRMRNAEADAKADESVPANQGHVQPTRMSETLAKNKKTGSSARRQALEQPRG